MAERVNIVSIGEKLPKELHGVVQSLGMTLTTVDHENFDPFKENAHAVLWNVTTQSITKLRGRLARLLECILDAGSLLILITSPGRLFAAVSELVMERARVARPTMKMIGEVYPGIRLIHRNSPELAKLLRTHNSGLPFDGALIVDSPERLKGTPDERLLTRAFHGFRHLAVVNMGGGKSGCTVWRVDATKNGHCCEPFIAKIGPRRALEVESNTWREFILDYIPFPFRAPPIQDRIVFGAQNAVLVSRFVDRATRFDDYVAQVNDPGGAIAALFNGALRTWRCNAQPIRNVKLGEMYVRQMEQDKLLAEQDEITGLPPRSILPDFARLVAAHELAVTEDVNVPSPPELMAMLLRVPKTEIREARVHGDLNARNLFVTWTGTQIVLIDFTHAGSIAPLSRDPSRLEVSIAFDKGEGRDPLTGNVLLSLYKFPLLHHLSNARRQDGRIEAVNQIRRHIAGEGIGNEEYALTTACHLLRFARSPRSQNDEDAPTDAQLRALAYRVASGLITSLPRA